MRYWRGVRGGVEQDVVGVLWRQARTAVSLALQCWFLFFFLNLVLHTTTATASYAKKAVFPLAVCYVHADDACLSAARCLLPCFYLAVNRRTAWTTEETAVGGEQGVCKREREGLWMQSARGAWVR